MFSSAIATLIYINSDVTILGVLKDDIVVGLYSVSAKIYTLIKQLLNALLVFAIPRISNEIARKEFEVVDKHYNKIFSYLILILGPACTGLFVLSENIIELFCGAEYLQAANSLKILAIALVLATMACFFVNVVMIPNQMEKYVLRSTILSAMVNIALNLLLIPNWGQNAAALTTVIAEMIMLISGIYYTRKVLSLHFNNSILLSIISSIAVFIICLISRRSFENNILTIVVSIVCSGVFWSICIVGEKYFKTWYENLTSRK